MRNFLIVSLLVIVVSGCSAPIETQAATQLPVELPTLQLVTEVPTLAPLPTETDLPPATAAPEPTQAPDLVELSAEQQLAAQAIVDSVCAVCHSPNKVKSVQEDQAGWVKIITQMQAKGAAIPDSDIELLAQYLASNP